MLDKTGRQLSLKEVIEKMFQRLSNILLELEIFLLHLVGSIPSHHFRRWCYRLAGVKIGKGSTIHMGAVFYNPRGIIIGEDTIIGEKAVLDGREKI